MSDLVGNPEDQFSHNVAQITSDAEFEFASGLISDYKNNADFWIGAKEDRDIE